ncbi:hypothetical protein OROMI_011011 [Orobanche minor]
MEDDRMHDQNGSHDTGEPSNNASKRKKYKPRGPSKGLKHKPGVVREIERDEINRPVGKWKKQFVNHIGNISRRKISILIDSWKNVPQGLKDTLWLDVKREFRVEDNPFNKAKVLQKCCTAWTGHKTKLVTGWIECSRPMPINKRMPYEEYKDHISEEVWNEFVKMHTTDEAKRKREKARQSQSFNKHPHNMGQQSYADKVPIWREEGLMPALSTPSMSTSETCTPISTVSDRTLAWVLARSKQDEEGRLYVPNEETRILKVSIDEWTKKQNEGEFVPGRLDDALNRALGKRDRHGRTLGFGSGIPIKQVWGLDHQKGNIMKDADIEEMERRVTQKVRAETMAEMNSKLEDLVQEKFEALVRQRGLKLTSQMEVETNSPITPHARSSCQSGGANSLSTQKVNGKDPMSCQLAVFMNNQMERVIVAEGMWYPTMRIHHHKEIPAANVRVTVDRYEKKYKDVLIPVPSASLKKLSQVHGTFKGMSKESTTKRDKVVSGGLAKKVESSGKRKVASGHDTVGSVTKPNNVFRYDEKFQHVSQICKSMHASLSLFPKEGVISMPFDKTNLLYDCENIPITRENIMDLIKGDNLEVPVLQVYIMALWADNDENLSFQNAFGFMCPYMISANFQTNNMNESMTYMTKAMQQQSSKRFIFCPYYENCHWILLVLCIRRNEVYVFDSSMPIEKRKRILTIRLSLSNAFRNFKMLAGQFTGNVLAWNDADCAQQIGSTECGFFVMRYIHEIIDSHHPNDNLTKVLKRSSPYSVEEINVVRDIWAAYFIGSAPI